MTAFFHFFLLNRSEIAFLTLQHLYLVLAGTGAGTFFGVPAGIFLTRKPAFSKPVLAAANVIQTIPSLALFGFLVPLLGSHGIGSVPAVIALFLYSLLPIIRNTYAGIAGIDPAVREAAIAMGMTGSQLLLQVEIPLALEVILAGIRVATVISIGTATIAAAIGAGGLGTYVFRGLREGDNLLILAGAVPAAGMALLADFLFERLQKTLAAGPRPGKRRRFAGRARSVTAAALFLAAVLGAFLYMVFRRPRRLAEIHPIVIGSKDFTEQVILGELLSQTLEARAGLPVKREFELGGDLCQRFAVRGKIDAYVEYTGTAYTAVLKHPPVSNPKKVFQTVQKEYAKRWNLIWLPPLGFNNTFAVLVREKDARKFRWKKISDLAPYAARLRAGFGQDFMSRPDGYPGLVRAYGLRFAVPPREMDLALTYRALAYGKIDVAAGNSTDGMIQKLHLRSLEDDRRFFPPYQAAPVVRGEILARYPQVKQAWESLAGKISNKKMRRMNYEVDAEHRDPKQVARQFLTVFQKPPDCGNIKK